MAGNIYDWSLTPDDNDNADNSIDWTEGQFPDTVNNSARMMMTRIAEWLRDQGVLAATGTDSAIMITAHSAFTSYMNGIRLSFKASATNPGATTLAVNGLGGKAIRKFVRGSEGDQPLAAGDIQEDGVYSVVYDAAANSGAGAWIIENPASSDLTGGANTWSGTQTFDDGIVISDGDTSSFDVTASTDGDDNPVLTVSLDGEDDPLFRIGADSIGTSFDDIFVGIGQDGTGGTKVDAFPSGTSMVFYQATAPTGWTKGTGFTNAALRLVDDGGGSVSSGRPFTAVFQDDLTVDGTVHGRTLTVNMIPEHEHGSGSLVAANHTHGSGSLTTTTAGAHSHNVRTASGSGGGSGSPYLSSEVTSQFDNYSTTTSGNHSHNVTGNTGGSGTINVSGTTGTAGGGNAHDHGWSGSVDLGVRYADVIIATKD